MPDRKTRWGARIALPLLVLATACSQEAAPPGAATADEEQQLNDAAAMLEANSVALDNATIDEAP